MRVDASSASRVLGLWPWLALGFMVLSAGYARVSLGHWPVVFRDNPTDPLLLATAELVALSLISTCAVIPLTLVLLGVRHAANVRPTFDRWVAAALAGTAIFYAMTWWDPSGYVEWILD